MATIRHLNQISSLCNTSSLAFRSNLFLTYVV